MGAVLKHCAEALQAALSSQVRAKGWSAAIGVIHSSNMTVCYRPEAGIRQRVKALGSDSSKYRPPGLLDYLWFTSCLCVIVLVVSVGMGYRNRYGIASTALAFGLISTAVLVRHWTRRAPLRRWGAVITHSERPVAYHVCCAVLVLFGLMACTGAVMTLVS